MTYSDCSVECSGNCSGWQSFRLVVRSVSAELQALECPFHCLRGRVDVALRNRDAAVSRNDGEGVHSRFSESS